MNLFNSTFKAKPGTGLKRTGSLKRSRMKAWRPKKRSTELSTHFDQVIALGPPPGMEGAGRLTIHHCHGGSMKDQGFHRAMSKKPSDWLVIALPEDLHTGSQGIDSGMGVITWEEKYGGQYQALEWVSERLGVDVLENATGDV